MPGRLALDAHPATKGRCQLVPLVGYTVFDGTKPGRIAYGNLPDNQWTIERWFAPDAFVAPRVRQWDNSGRNVLYEPGTKLANVPVHKNLSVGERKPDLPDECERAMSFRDLKSLLRPACRRYDPHARARPRNGIGFRPGASLSDSKCPQRHQSIESVARRPKPKAVEAGIRSRT